ncbi:Stk1 family PASTA domain-containing Ser/Thr kinase [Microbacterium sp. M3]|uniref:non-specific serine/threonine protein kinase n=1 Tax=Microbacterium arthrosphaerae TaxID=792652 RepID=A0ABU4H2Y1_9MICO|nr:MULTISPECIES: Stk1 family PASTA domain-containing Ser/Thr kinase [Microbacterium]MDW4572269.1 Stk1 family PASTA domain-containing Ser/Thr kinase [Microbacterium arthrosphaerae]MDW7606124.1 Stk1 family PASTA domain-containing Ser/Thr kinase [Microbacterium sp. M3]
MSTSQQTDPLIGRLVDGRYRVRARIARGGMATVYVATDLRLERRVALKVMHGHLSDDTVFQSRFIQEARAAARLADPHVVNVFDQGQDGDMAYLVMEYLPGITLRELLREQRRLTVPQAVSILDAVLSGLAAAHRAGIVHRDVKPENVLLAEDGRIKIGDFGLARATTANTASGAQLLGTIAYLAPELVTRGTADARSDIYAIGIMLYEMLTGEQPYKGEQPMQIAFQHATDSVPRPSVKNPGVPEPLDELVLWATEKSPDERPIDAREMLQRLREIERELGITPNVTRTGPVGVIRETGVQTGELTAVLPAAATGPTAAIDDADNAGRLRRATRRRRTRGAWLVVLVLLLAALAGGLGWWFGSGPGSLVPVADVTGVTSFQEASDILAQDSLVATEQGENSLEVPAGTVIRTDPTGGTRVDRDSSVTVFVSLGPAAADFGSFAGVAEADARATLEAQSVGVPEESATFFTDAAAGTVIGVSIRPAGAPDDGSGDVACLDGCSVHQGDTARLQVSLGPLPDVAGESEGKARSTLEGLQLVVADPSQTEASDQVDEGRVIRLIGKDDGGWLAPGDTVTLVVSTGPPLFAVPNLVDLTLAEARKAAEDAGFTIDYDDRWDAFPDPFTRVESQKPDAGDMEPRGTVISLRIAAAL